MMSRYKKDGYIVVPVSEYYRGSRVCDPNHAYEHHVVWFNETGKLIPKGYVLHHKNQRKDDNRFKNLELMTRAEHASSHARPLTVWEFECPQCYTEFERDCRFVNHKISKGQKLFFCSRSCASKYQHQLGGKLR